MAQVGDAVALEPGVPCCNNVYTREGRYNLDPDIRMFATPPNHGVLAQACALEHMQIQCRISGPKAKWHLVLRTSAPHWP